MKERLRKRILNKNKKYSEKFIQPTSNPILPNYIKEIFDNYSIKNFIDLGCGDGILIKAVNKQYPEINITGVDISPRRINLLKKRFPKNIFYMKDVCNTKLDNQYDFVHSSQVIEHVPSDKEMVDEMERLLKKEGIIFCSSVIKKRWAVYKYLSNGKFVLDPTHEREYKNQKEFLDLFKKRFKLIKSWVLPVRRKLLGKSVQIPGYYLVYGIWKKRK